MKLNKIFITHWHGDHALGLGGIIQSLSASGRTADLEIYGPKRTIEHVRHILEAFEFDLGYKIRAYDIKTKFGVTKRIYETKDVAVDAMQVKHIIPCLAYSFIEKGHRKIDLNYTKKFGLVKHPLLGKLQENKSIIYKGKRISPKKATFMTPDKKISYITDTSSFRGIENIADGADILICESTYSEELKEKAGRYSHLTAMDAANIAKKARVKKLVLTHFSQRFSDNKNLVLEAGKIFSKVSAANDFDKLIIK